MYVCINNIHVFIFTHTYTNTQTHTLKYSSLHNYHCT